MNFRANWGRRIPRLFLDTNIAIYASGRPHPLKEPCQEIILFVGAQPRQFVTDVEVFQEILHRHLSSGRWAEGQFAFARFFRLMSGRIEPVYGEDVAAAADLADRYPAVQARDLLHAAVMQRLGVDAIVSADRGFDAIEGIMRFDPSDPSAVRQYGLS
jgi:predicted nucleic acid-binding protein